MVSSGRRSRGKSLILWISLIFELVLSLMRHSNLLQLMMGNYRMFDSAHSYRADSLRPHLCIMWAHWLWEYSLSYWWMTPSYEPVRPIRLSLCGVVDEVGISHDCHSSFHQLSSEMRDIRASPSIQKGFRDLMRHAEWETTSFADAFESSLTKHLENP